MVKPLYKKGQTVKLRWTRAISLPLSEEHFELAEGVIGTVELSLGGSYLVKFPVTSGLSVTLKISEVDLMDPGQVK
jgi:hypothetical protein